MKSKYTVLDMFSGAGGLSEGFFKQGFKFISHLEKNNHARKSLETRAIYHALKDSSNEGIYKDYILGNINRDEFIRNFNELELSPVGLLQGEILESNEDSLKEEIRTHMDVLDIDSVDVMIGGPPCQAYSLAGRGRKPEEMRNDPRNYLYKRYISFLKTFEPEIFVFENVLGIRTAKDGTIYSNLHEEIKKLGYKTEAHVLNAKNFSVLQDRKRIIFIGWKEEHDLSYPEFPEKPPQIYSVSDILEDLPALKPGGGTDNPVEYSKPFLPLCHYLRKFSLRELDDVLIQHRARIHNSQDRNIYRRIIYNWDKNRTRLKYNELPEKLQTHQNKNSFRDRFKVVDQNGYSHAILAHLSKDGHHFIHPDIKQARSLTVREAARIQSFPDNYKLEGPRIAQYAQVGNAVPPLMARGIAVEIEKMLKEIL